MMCSADGYLYEHECGFSYDSDSSVFAESGTIEIGNGDILMMVKGLIPDENTLGGVTATFKTRLYPTASETSHGPYNLANPTSLRFQGRQVEVRIDANSTDWRVGVMRLEAQRGGRR